MTFSRTIHARHRGLSSIAISFPLTFAFTCACLPAQAVAQVAKNAPAPAPVQAAPGPEQRESLPIAPQPIATQRIAAGQIAITGPEEVTSPLAETRLALTGLRFVGFSADGKWLRVGSTKGRFQQLSTSTLAPLAESEALPPFGTAAAAITRDKRWTVVGNWRGLAVFFNTQTLEIEGQYPDDPETDPTPITAMKLDDKATLLVTGQRSSVIRLHAINPPELRWVSEKLEQEVSGVDLSNDGKLVAVSTGLLKDFNAPGKLVVLDAANGKILFQHTAMASKVNHVAISPDCLKILAADNQSLKVFSSSGKQIESIPIGGIQRFKFVDNDRIVLSRFPGWLGLLNLKEHRLDKLYAGHAKNPEIQESQLIWALDIAPDGKSFASADTHGNVGIWPLATQ